jgi:hypothetical protein
MYLILSISIVVGICYYLRKNTYLIILVMNAIYNRVNRYVNYMGYIRDVKYVKITELLTFIISVMFSMTVLFVLLTVILILLPIYMLHIIFIYIGLKITQKRWEDPLNWLQCLDCENTRMSIGFNYMSEHDALVDIQV